MAWNEPGNSKNDKDPWTGKPKQAGGPPDLEAVLRNLRKKLNQLLDKKNSKEDKSSSSSSGSGKLSNFGLGTIALLILVAWGIWGIFIVDPAEQAVILRFGKYVRTVGPGPHWIPRLIETAYTINEQRISTYSYSAEMLTKDQNIVSVALAVQYRITNARDYLFNVVKPDESLQQATASALRQVIGQTNLDQVLTSGREQIRQQVSQYLATIMAKYQTGLIITDIAMQPAKAPDEVKSAFDDAIKAQEDEQRFENQAQAYAMQVVPIAKGQALRLMAEAKGYQQQTVFKAQAETAPFLALLPQYQKFPAVTRERLYLETIQHVLGNSSKILVDVNSSNNMFYLPLDQILRQRLKAATTDTSAVPAPVAASAPTPAAPSEGTQNSSYPNPQEGYQ